MTSTLRDCAGCALCCQLLAIPELGKSANKCCDRLCGGRCLRYAERPVACRNYFCLWVANQGFPDELRPDRCGAIFEPVRGKDVVLVNVDPARPHVWKDGVIAALISRFLERGTPVGIVVGSRNFYKLPPRGTLSALWRDLREVAPHYGWRV